MFVFSLVSSAVLLVLANLIAYRSKYPGLKILGLCLVFLIAPPSLALVLPPVTLLAVLLPVGLMIWKSTRRGPGFFLKLSFAATLPALALPAVQGYRAEQGFVVLRARYPFESMEGRVPPPKPASRMTLPSPAMQRRLDERDESSDRWNRRTNQLRRLHEDAVGLFVRNYGFGISRMGSPAPTEWVLAFGSERESLAQPGRRIALAGSPGEWGQPLPSLAERLGRLHELGLSDFVDALTFGYVKDRGHVAGFQPHRFHHVPNESKLLTLETLDLVGLLVHEEPIAYVSSNLPSMDELRQAPTRPLDRFEKLALGSLQDGDDHWIVTEGDTIRMLGAIRSSKQCVACHGGERGDLLGAFSYTITQNEGVIDPGSAP